MKKLVVSFSALVFSTSMFAQIFVAKTCEVSFFSASPLENIEATAKVPKTFLNTATNDVQIQITNTAFMFEKPLMQEHFNENYMESEKYPNTIFKGKINEKIDYTKDGEHKVTVTGKMSMHGVDKDITIDGVLTVKGGEILLFSKFKVQVADYKIKVPSLYVQNIAEIVDVKLNAVLGPIKKN